MSGKCVKSVMWAMPRASPALRCPRNSARASISISIAWKALPSSFFPRTLTVLMSYSRLLLAILVVGWAAGLARGQDDAEQVRLQQLDARVQQYVQLLQPA